MTYRSLPMEPVTDDVDPEDIPTWRDDAACRGFDISVFFPDEGDSKAIAHAKEICRTCPVMDDCAAYAVEHNQTEGIWGATTRQERRRLRRIWLKDLREVG